MSGLTLDLAQVRTPCFVICMDALERNLQCLNTVQQQTGAKILLALKAFAAFPCFPLIRRYLPGTTASSPDEARLGRDVFGGEVHVCAPAYSESDMEALLTLADHIVFNSFSQWERFRTRVEQSARRPSCGLRVNPCHSEVTTAKYDPCQPGSRLGTVLREFHKDRLEGISGLHFHSLCELNSDALERTLAVVERDYGEIMHRMEWVNLGGGHHITRPDYDRDRLCRLIAHVRDTYQVQVYLEPGEAVALQAGVLVASVLDITRNDMAIAVLDTSASAHMPDVMEMPYRPEIAGAGKPGEYPHTYRLGGVSCLAGDIVGDYSFPEPLQVGQKLVFGDMAHYSMVKTNTFNGVRLPSIALWDPAAGDYRVVREFGYEDFKGRLG